MAKVTVKRDDPVLPPAKEVVLTLTPDEARALRSRMFNHSTSPTEAQRRDSNFLNNIYRALAAESI